MVKKPRKKAAKALDNLCLEVPLPPAAPSYWDTLYSKVPLQIDPANLVPIDFRPLPWTPASAIQSRSRAQRAMPVQTTQHVVAQSAALDLKALETIIQKYQADMTNMMIGNIRAPGHRLPNFDQLYLNHQERPQRARAEDLGCVDGLIQAMRDTGGYDGVRMDYRVRDPMRDDPYFLNRWIFGPRGEFTGFARVDALLPTLKHSMRTARRGDVFRGGLEGYPLEVTFKITLLRGIDDIRMSPLRSEPLAYFQFATYHDYAAWESMAAYDRTDIHGL